MPWNPWPLPTKPAANTRGYEPLSEISPVAIDRATRPPSIDGLLLMDQFFHDAVLDARIRQHIRRTAWRLARTGLVPGMDSDDIEQDLFLDLWRRRIKYLPDKAGFATFADQIIAHRAATLTYPTARLLGERRQVGLDRSADGDESLTLAERLADPAAPDEVSLGLAMDLRRFVAGLTPALRTCCDILLAPNVRSATARAGVHHSSFYENAHRLRQKAEAAGLREYLPPPRHIERRAGKWLP